MKALLGTFVLTLIVSTALVAQDSPMPMPSQSAANGSATMSQGDAPAGQGANTPASMPGTGSSMPASAHKASGSEGYGGRAEIFVTGFGFFGSRSNGNAITQQETDAGGAAVGYRYHLNSSSAIEGRYGFSRDSQNYTIGGVVSSIPTYFSEISGSYVYTFTKSQHIRPFLEGGGGVVLFIPGNYNNNNLPTSAITTTTAGAAIVGIPGYTAVNSQGAVVPVYTGSSAGIGTQAKGMFLYGAGIDIPATSHLSFRTEFRGLGYKAPDFKLTALQTNAFSFSYEPSLGIVYRF